MPRGFRSDSSNRPVPPGASVCTPCTALYKWPMKAHCWALLRYVQVAQSMHTTTQRVVWGHTSTSQLVGRWVAAQVTAVAYLHIKQITEILTLLPSPACSPPQKQNIALHKNLRIMLNSSEQGARSPPIVSAPLGDP